MESDLRGQGGKNMKIKVNDKEYGVAEVMKNGNTYIPVLSIKMMSDEYWEELAKRGV